MQCSRWGLIRVEWMKRITSLNVLVVLSFLCSPGYHWLSEQQMHVATLCPNFHPPISLSLSVQGACSQFTLQSVLVFGMALAWVQGHAFEIVSFMHWHCELHEVHVSALFEPAKVPLHGVPSLQWISGPAEPGGTHKLAEGALHPTLLLVKILHSVWIATISANSLKTLGWIPLGAMDFCLFTFLRQSWTWYFPTVGEGFCSPGICHEFHRLRRWERETASENWGKKIVGYLSILYASSH